MPSSDVIRIQCCCFKKANRLVCSSCWVIIVHAVILAQERACSQCAVYQWGARGVTGADWWKDNLHLWPHPACACTQCQVSAASFLSLSNTTSGYKVLSPWISPRFKAFKTSLEYWSYLTNSFWDDFLAGIKQYHFVEFTAGVPCRVRWGFGQLFLQQKKPPQFCFLLWMLILTLLFEFSLSNFQGQEFFLCLSNCLSISDMNTCPEWECEPNTLFCG